MTRHLALASLVTFLSLPSCNTDAGYQPDDSAAPLADAATTSDLACTPRLNRSGLLLPHVQPRSGAGVPRKEPLQLSNT